MTPRLVRYWDFPERWRPKKPKRVWGVLYRELRESHKMRVRSFAARETAEDYLALVRGRGGILLQLWFDGCVGPRGRRGFLTQWQEAR